MLDQAQPSLGKCVARQERALLLLGMRSSCLARRWPLHTPVPQALPPHQDDQGAAGSGAGLCAGGARNGGQPRRQRAVRHAGAMADMPSSMCCDSSPRAGCPPPHPIHSSLPAASARMRALRMPCSIRRAATRGACCRSAWLTLLHERCCPAELSAGLAGVKQPPLPTLCSYDENADVTQPWDATQAKKPGDS